MTKLILTNFLIAIEALSNNRLRAFLTSLGLIFGVASVISMLSIGKGAEQEILQQLQLLGANNIIIKPVIKQEEGKVEADNAKLEEKERFSPGLTLQDIKVIKKIIPHVTLVIPEVVYETLVIRSGMKRSVKLVGVSPDYFSSSGIILEQGNRFSDYHQENVSPVCVIGAGIKAKFFPKEEPLGKKIKCGQLWLTVIGVAKDRKISEKDITKLGIRNYNMDIYSPISTVILRSKNRALVTQEDILRNARREDDNDRKQNENYNQLDQVTVKVADTKYMAAVAGVLNRMLKRLHNDVVDFEIILPLALLEQEQRSKRIFNIVLGAIASISLLVGGIGIMNIMLASVLERIKEIGVRMAVGATARDIIMQFLFEAITMSISGGLIGVIVGYLLSFTIEQFSGIITIITPFSVIISLLVAISVGLIFGILPARRASEQDPIYSLRYE
jgi:putative ABC transport system permease protein